MTKPPNSYDVARAAGVSRTVVSLVLNGKADRYGIAKATQERVRAAIRRTGYVPNMFVRELFLKRREAVGVGQPGATPDPVKVSAVVRQPLSAAGYRMQVAEVSADPREAERQIVALLKSGLVVLVAPEPRAMQAEPSVPVTAAASDPDPAPFPAESVPEPQPEPLVTREEPAAPQAVQGEPTPPPIETASPPPEEEGTKEPEPSVQAPTAAPPASPDLAESRDKDERVPSSVAAVLRTASSSLAERQPQKHAAETPYVPGGAVRPGDRSAVNVADVLERLRQKRRR